MVPTIYISENLTCTYIFSKFNWLKINAMTEHLSMDQVFINKLTDIVLANLADEDFGVNRLAMEVGMSRVTIHRRIKAIKNQNISQFIREVRLQRAMKMLQQNEGTVAEIAFSVGFGSPTYFNKCFHEYFGFPPGEVRKGEIAESFYNLADEQSGDAVTFKEIKSRPDLKSVSKRLHYKKIMIATLGILSGLLIIYFLYILFIQDSGIISRTKYPEKSIVVLPFKNLTDNPENQYFADGIMEDILNHLFRIREMRVISRTTADHFRGSQMTSPEIAKSLNVNYILEGSVQIYEREVRIFIQLIEARDDQNILSEKFEGEMTNIFAFQSDMAKKIANALEAILSSEEIGQIEKIPTNNPEAYDYYLKGRFLLHKANDEQRFDINRAGLMVSLQYYEKAIAADKDFVEAYAGLANAWFNLSAWGWYQPYDEGIQKARDFTSKALEIDPDCAEAHAVKGIYLVYPECRFEDGRRELQISLELNPNFSTAHQWYAQLLMITGPIEEARAHIDLALELEPYFWVVHNLNAWICYFEEEYRKGINACLVARDLNPNFIHNIWLFFLHYIKLGEGEKAVKELQSIFSRFPATSLYADEILNAFNKSGIEGIFTWLIDVNINKPVVRLEGINGHPFYIAWWYAILGNREESIYWFERTLEAQRIPLHYFNLIATNPDFDILRDDPRFQAIIEKAGLAPYNTRKTR
jgi:TolB-like protein/AraC-like DNA-binding protein